MGKGARYGRHQDLRDTDMYRCKFKLLVPAHLLACASSAHGRVFYSGGITRPGSPYEQPSDWLKQTALCSHLAV